LRDYYIELRETRNATLDEARDGLINDLKERETPLVIVIDDIDRLEAAEIRQVIQTVKAVSNLPNVVFLLLFQREVVESALEEIAGEGKGGQFLAKAILAGFHVPEPPPGRIVEMLDERIAQFRKAPDFSLHWDDPRWQQSVKPALMPFFRTARDVIRFSATLQVYIEQHRQNNMLEVNPIDLTALETIRMFEPDMFERLAQIPVVEPSQIIPSMDTDEELEKKAELELSELVGFASTARKEYTSKLLGCLFPRFGARIASKVIEESPEWDRELRICHPLYYSRYFDLALTANRVTDREFQIIIKDSANIEKLNADLGELNNGKILPDFMARFFPHLSEIPASNVPVFIRAISEAGESLPDLYEDSEGRGSKDNAGALIYQALRNLPEAGERREALRTLLEQSPSLDIGIHLVATIESTVKKNDPSNPPILSASDVAELVAIALRRIRNEAKTGVLMTRPWLTRHLYRWSEWASPSETKAWLAGYLTDPAKARAFINRWTSRIIRSGTPNEFIPCLDGEGLDRLVGFDLLDQILAKPGGDEPMSSDEAMALKLYERAKELKASGHPSTVVNFKGV
jgi:predicted KAP-like P-loop ATPase